MSDRIRQLYDSLENNFFGRWIKNFRISVMVLVLLLWYGTYSLIQIPKESSPDIKFGLVSINTVYPWANPIDIDNLITNKLESDIKNLNGIDKIEATSSIGISTILITLKNGIDTKDFINDVKNKVDKVLLPLDAKSPIVTEISSSNEILFEMMLVWPSGQFGQNHIRTLANNLKAHIKGQWGIVDVKIAGQKNDSDYDIEIQINPTQAKQLGISIGQISQIIKSFNTNIPLGSYRVGDLNYDYRINGENSSIEQLLRIPIKTPWGTVNLGNIATIVRNYTALGRSLGGGYGVSGQTAISMTIYKANRVNIFKTATSAKEVIESELKKQRYQWLKVSYTRDLSDTIIDDYSSLSSNALQSIVMIFLITWFFIWLRQSLIATIAMPVAFFITFIILNSFGYTLNFLTNFSLILTFGMGIDTVIVIIEAGYEYMKQWFNSKTGILLALKNYALPNITSSLANMVVFLPMIMLPGITGKFLAYIPITVFITLLASLFLASSINNAFFQKINTNLKYYFADQEDEKHEEVLLGEDEKELLALERVGKEKRWRDQEKLSDRWIDRIAQWYVHLLQWILNSKLWRRVAIFWPIGLLILSFVLLSPRIGFKLFPSGDNPFINFEIIGKVGMHTDAMMPYTNGLDTIIAQIPEVKNYTITVQDNSIDILVILTKKWERNRNSFDIQTEIESGFSYLAHQGLKVQGKVQAEWPPQGKAIGLKLVAEDTSLLADLKKVSVDFETYLKSLTGVVNVTNSSSNNPGQFEITRDRDQLSVLGLTPTDIQWEVYVALNGVKSSTIQLDGRERDIRVKWGNLTGGLDPSTLMAMTIPTSAGAITLWSVAQYQINQSLSVIKRKDGKLTIAVEGDTAPGVVTTDVQPLFVTWAEQYKFPRGISYVDGGENAANADLISATISSFFIAIFLVFLILVYQFNSFSKPMIILYSIITALLGVNVGLRITGNPYSMPFAIGFISLIGIVVNNAIFLIDKMNKNLELGTDIYTACREAGYTRFKPIIISALTTILGIVSLVFKDEFWAGLAWTVVFGLFFSAFMTLFSIPSIFYAVYAKRSQKNTPVQSESPISPSI